jgi:hypothetical protein
VYPISLATLLRTSFPSPKYLTLQTSSLIKGCESYTKDLVKILVCRHKYLRGISLKTEILIVMTMKIPNLRKIRFDNQIGQ